jgi:hypothetical protein
MWIAPDYGEAWYKRKKIEAALQAHVDWSQF